MWAKPEWVSMERKTAKKIVEIEHPKITKELIVARVVAYEDGTAEIQTFYRPQKKWVEGVSIGMRIFMQTG